MQTVGEKLEFENGETCFSIFISSEIKMWLDKQKPTFLQALVLKLSFLQELAVSASLKHIDLSMMEQNYNLFIALHVKTSLELSLN